MSFPRRSSRLAPGSAFLLVLLLLMLGLPSVLGYQALDAARAEARAADRELRAYAGIAQSELSRRADQVFTERLVAAAAEARRALEAAEARGADERQALAAYAAAARGALAWCRCPEAVKGVFRADPDGRGHRLVAEGGARAFLPWLEAAEWGPMHGPPASRVVGPDTLMMAAAERPESRDFLFYQTQVRGDGKVRAFGIVVDRWRLAVPAVAEVLDGHPLLPHTVGSGLGNRQAVAVVLATPAGEEVFRFPAVAARDAAWAGAKVGAIGPEAVPRGAVRRWMGGLLAPMRARVNVRPSLAAGAAGGGPPESRLPLLGTVFGLTLALFCVAVVQLRRQQELVRLRDDFVSGVSHELRTPLAQIRLFADLLESGRLADAGQRARSVRIINEESRRLTYLVENILHFSRGQRGASRLAPQPVQVGALVREIVDGFAPLARDASFATRVEDGVVARIDRDAFRQVLLNLLDNAAKYGPRGQTVQVGMAVSGFAVRVWVQDAGPGVPREDRARVWEPYRRLDREADAAVGGSGIGLAVVRDLVELHGGRAWVEDAPGGGARFVIQLPGATYAGPPGEEEPAPAVPDPATVGAP